jgi:hypothetical protein
MHDGPAAQRLGQRRIVGRFSRAMEVPAVSGSVAVQVRQRCSTVRATSAEKKTPPP